MMADTPFEDYLEKQLAAALKNHFEEREQYAPPRVGPGRPRRIGPPEWERLGMKRSTYFARKKKQRARAIAT